MPRTGPITAGWREVERRAADWRMRPASEDGRDNTTRLERGPQGSGGVVEVHRPDIEPGIGVTMTAGSKRPSNRGQRPRSRGSG